MKRKKIFSILSIAFTVLSFASFKLALLDLIYILTLEKGLASVLIGFYFALICLVLLILVLVFGVLGGVFSLINLKKQGRKALYVTTLSMSSALTVISSVPIILVIILSCFG